MGKWGGERRYTRTSPTAKPISHHNWEKREGGERGEREREQNGMMGKKAKKEKEMKNKE